MKKALFFIACIIAAVLFTACAGSADDALAEMQESNENALKITGEFIGMSDSNYFEVRIAENTYKVLMIPEKTRTAFEKLKLKNGEKITVAYEKNSAGQLEAAEIARVTEDQQATGKYVGLADSNSFEVQLDNSEKKEFKVFTLTDKVRDAFEKLKLKKDDRITLRYTENKDGQLLVNSIKKAK